MLELTDLKVIDGRCMFLIECGDQKFEVSTFLTVDDRWSWRVDRGAGLFVAAGTNDNRGVAYHMACQAIVKCSNEARESAVSAAIAENDPTEALLLDSEEYYQEDDA